MRRDLERAADACMILRVATQAGIKKARALPRPLKQLRRTDLIVAVNLFAPLVPLLSLNGKRGDGAGVETLQ